MSKVHEDVRKEFPLDQEEKVGEFLHDYRTIQFIQSKHKHDDDKVMISAFVDKSSGFMGICGGGTEKDLANLFYQMIKEESMVSRAIIVAVKTIIEEKQ